MKLIFAGYTGSKNSVRNRLKIQFVKLDFSKLIFEKLSTDQQGVSLYLLIQFWLCYRTIYVPYENAVNVPDIFDVSVGAGFGYSDQPPVTKSPAAVQSSYDNPISSFDAPIYDENSYTAEAVSY